METATITAKAGRAVREGHPWVFSNSVREVTGAPASGDTVRVVQAAAEGAGPKDLGTAFFNPHSLIAIRHLSFEGELPDRGLVSRRLAAARAWRSRLYPDSDCWRLCHGESDFLPGLLVDRYGDAFVVQSLSAGADALQAVVANVLMEEHGARSVIERNESPLRDLEGLPRRSGLLAGEEPGEVLVSVPPLTLAVQPATGQKTGAFLDQRENRAAAARHARGVRVYDAYCHAGALAALAARAGAESVIGVDSSAEALASARRTAELNGVAGAVTFEQADAQADMEARHRRKERFGLVCVDPPSFTRSRKQVPQARKAYRELNRRAMTLVERGGILVTSSCSHHVREDTFLEALQRAAQDAARTLRLVELRSQSPDHPVLAAMPESRYLKCVIAQVL